MSATAQTSTVYTSQNKQQHFLFRATLKVITVLKFQDSLLWLCVPSVSVTFIIAVMSATAEAHGISLLTHMMSMQAC